MTVKINDKVRVINNPMPNYIKKINPNNEWIVSKVIELQGRTTIVVKANDCGEYSFKENDVVKVAQ